MMRSTVLSAMVASMVSGSAWAADGLLEGHIFASGSGAPVADARIVVDGRPVGSTNADGAFEVRLPEGSHRLAVEVNGARQHVGDFPVVDDEATEILLTWYGPGAAPHAEAELPAAPGPSSEQPVALGAGTLRGRVSSDEDGAPVVGARLYVLGTQVEVETDADGAFEVALPPGSYGLSVIHPRFASQSLSGLEVGADADTAISVELVPAGMALDDFYVRAPQVSSNQAHLDRQRMDSTAVGESIGRDAMRRAGASDAAGALGGVTGLTVVGGKYIFVRGLGERYSQTTLNGAGLPSPEPERRVIPLDLFPTGVLDSITIQKTFSPDKPAEFGGGVVQLKTRGLPEEPIFEVSLGGNYQHGSTFTKGWASPAGPTDFLGIDGGHRAMPDAVHDASHGGGLYPGGRFNPEGYSPEELEAFGESMSKDWWPEQKKLPVGMGIGFTGGTGWDVGQGKMGFLVGGGYKNEWSRKQYERTYYLAGAGGALEPSHSYDFDDTDHEVNLAGMFAFGWEVNDRHQLRLSSMVLRSTVDQARWYTGYNRDAGADLRLSRLRWQERMLAFNQLVGDHDLGPISLQWRYSFSLATGNEPDRRQTRYDWVEQLGSWQSSDRPEASQRFWSQSQDRAHDVGLDLSIPLVRANGQGQRPKIHPVIKVGGMMLDKRRTVDARRLKFFHRGEKARDPDVLALDAPEMFDDANIGADGFVMEEFTKPTDNYNASHLVAAAYVMTDIPVNSWFRVMAGARLEHSNQQVITYSPFDDEDGANTIPAELVTTDVLPALTTTFSPRDDMRVRAGYGYTLSRPEFRELSPATFNDVTGGREKFGNPDLQRATIHNVDLRWEWFPAAGELLSVGGFFKEFKDPIETTVVPSAQLSLTWNNARGARSYGLEFEWRKGFGFVHRALQHFFVSGNVAVIHSRVQLDEDDKGVQTNLVRPLEGQSPYVINAQLGYAHPELGHFFTVVFNVAGPRIVEVGALGVPDTREMARPGLDLVAGVALPKGFGVQANVDNMLNSKVVVKVGDAIQTSYAEGWSAGLRLTWAPELRKREP